MRRLTVSHGPERRRLCLPLGDSARLGAAPDNDLVAPFAGVSRHHARLDSTPDGVLVVDLGSKNGLVCDGHRYENLLLTAQRRVMLGHAVLEVEEVAQEDVDLGLRFAPAARPQDPPAPRRTVSVAAATPPTQETRELADPSSVSPAPALRLLRRLGRRADAAEGDDRAALLAQARSALGADWLAIVDLDAAGDLTTADWCGPRAADGTLTTLEATLAAEPPRRGGVRRLEVAQQTVLTADAGTSRWIAAGFAGRLPPPPWVEEVLATLAEHLPRHHHAAPQAADAAAGGTAPGGTRGAAHPDPLRFPPGMVVGDSPAMAALLERLRATVRSDLSVLISGETGVGKELVAQLIHRSGAQSAGPFVAINCAAIPGELLEAELFGVAARAATGVDPRPGLFVRADGGSLFLDEVGEMPDRLQAKLLRVLQERAVWPVGRGRSQPVDVRVLAASNRDLVAAVAEGRFRRDLYYRLRGLSVEVPPLRERSDDLPPLILQLASRAAAKYDKRISGVTRAALDLLLAHPWPGNVRELENEVENAVLLCPPDGALESAHFPNLGTAAAAARGGGSGNDGGGNDGGAGGQTTDTAEASGDDGDGRTDGDERAGGDGRFRPLQERLDDVERQAIRQALAATGGVKARAAELLGITRNGLSLKLKRLGIDGESW